MTSMPRPPATPDAAPCTKPLSRIEQIKARALGDCPGDLNYPRRPDREAERKQREQRIAEHDRELAPIKVELAVDAFRAEANHGSLDKAIKAALDVASRPPTKPGGKRRISRHDLPGVLTALRRESDQFLHQKEAEMRKVCQGLARQHAGRRRIGNAGLARGRQHRAAPARTGGSRRCRAASSSSSDSSSGEPGPPPRWSVPNRPQGLSSFASFADFHELTPSLTGPERLVLFETLPAELRRTIYANLRSSLGGEWS